jgi:hypothetical protein
LVFDPNKQSIVLPSEVLNTKVVGLFLASALALVCLNNGNNAPNMQLLCFPDNSESSIFLHCIVSKESTLFFPR